MRVDVGVKELGEGEGGGDAGDERGRRRQISIELSRDGDEWRTNQTTGVSVSIYTEKERGQTSQQRLEGKACISFARGSPVGP